MFPLSGQPTIFDEQRSPYVEKKRSALKVSRNPQQVFERGARDLKEKLGIGGSVAVIVKEGRVQFLPVKRPHTRERYPHPYKECLVHLSNRCGTSQSTPLREPSVLAGTSIRNWL
ncbi:hypothetical protein PIB30_026935 [Stylosanthes scabra]|uniref:Uncharacterized protein n=1 Tax=Stylosanthes scabra TaxID=79078 RepID=A0ABU6YCR6_9FABA|nr:hypothetical protein [Stylosanthes scabra]